MTQTLSRETEGKQIPDAPTRSPIALALSDCRVLIGRNLKHITRNPEMLIQAVSLPIVLLLLFRFMFGGAINLPGMAYVDYLVPGLVAVSIGFNSTTTVVGVASDLTNGLVERFRSMPMAGPAVLVGHVTAGVLRSLLSLVVMVALGLAIGFRPGGGVLGWLGAVGLLVLFASGIFWLATLLGSIAKTVEGASGLGMILVFVPYATSALVPTASMPGVLRVVVDNQPVTVLIDAVRALMNGTAAGSTGWLALAWWAAITALAAFFAVRKFHQRSHG
ncbi:ABC transporter permease [Amycolatopsis sp. PS_44_ISF1]|uniref:ABC transporter permease n=1 Tax=Amycolatopsis sp. PS_44_ISF1 TaxID=2974917 RepID=UPI0028DE6D0B|nr:ABC transporter permease [Amycolatopsis sp. PS_44_ISF1]MDT8911883.1 ABC transporter permease [Amycolatopsis sp. PS_44_ISF1]MDT8916318.1 ABC transporter permease [Amycolatopsis sp. PS_44_ISF1]